MKTLLCTLLTCVVCSFTHAARTFTFGRNDNPQGKTFEVDRYGFIIDGRHAIPVMGEMHYARVPREEWRRELQKMRAGGITMVATYCFWIHHEAEEGHWDWSGNKDLHSFLQVCKEERMPVVLRIGPFCHGEVYQGGFPTWITDRAKADAKNYKLRSLAPGFMAAVKRLYSNIYAQAWDMLWKHGGTVVGVQIENECRGPWSYYMALRDVAVQIGFDVPFMTRTGWPKLNGKEEFGKLLPLYGDYADGFWDRTMTDMPKEYRDAFTMKEQRMSENIATETFGKYDKADAKDDASYPYLTCELGGGMMPAYHRRVNMSGNETMPLAICKLGSGSNLPGYYMYHGGTNPYNPDHTMAETQMTDVTNYNDMPYMTYDFQACLGEMGQPNNNSFHQTRLLHQFLADWGEELSQMDVDTMYSVKQKSGKEAWLSRRGCFEFYNDYVRIVNEGGVAYVRPVKMPFRGHEITAEVQPFCKLGDTICFIPVKGKKPVVMVDGKRLTAKYDKAYKVKDIVVLVLSPEKALRAFVIDGALHYASVPNAILYKDGDEIKEETWTVSDLTVTLDKTKDAGTPRTVTMGKQKVAAMPTNEDFDNAAVWELNLPDGLKGEGTFLQVDYAADCARVYADGRLVMDNFWNGKPMLVRVSDLLNADGTQKKVELRILPLKKDAPIYLQSQQKSELNAAKDGVLLNLKAVKVVLRF